MSAPPVDTAKLAEMCPCHRCRKVLIEPDRALCADCEQLAACAPFLKDGETPVECIQRNRNDIDALLTLLATKRLAAEAETPRETWQPINPSSPPIGEVFFWVVPKTEDEAYCDSSGRPITSNGPPRLHRGVYKSWSALEKATHWLPLPAPPELEKTEPAR